MVKRERKPKLPLKGDLVHTLILLKKEIGDEYRSEGQEDGPPSMDVTIGCDTMTGDWSYQIGDNSYTGGAYGYPDWAVITLSRRSNSSELADDILNQLADLFYSRI